MARIEILDFTIRMKPIVAFCKGLIPESEEEAQKCLFVVELDEIGESQAVNDFLRDEMRRLNQSDICFFTGKQLGLIIKSHGENYTKSFAKKFIFLCNVMGAEFIGHPLVEVLEGYQNFKTWQKALDMPLERICFEQIEQLVKRLYQYGPLGRETMQVLVLHAGYKEISNTLMLWEQIETKLLAHNSRCGGKRLCIDTLHVEEGKISDCYGCSFETCMYYAREKSCFYGGFVVEDLYPKLEKADIVVWICPNYNDAISAKLMAVINRLTALYRQMGFRDKYLYSVVVSGNSGSDSVARQLIGALNINKGFRLPPRFAIMALANEPGEIKEAFDIDSKISTYVNDMCSLIEENIKKY